MVARAESHKAPHYVHLAPYVTTWRCVTVCCHHMCEIRACTLSSLPPAVQPAPSHLHVQSGYSSRTLCSSSFCLRTMTIPKGSSQRLWTQGAPNHACSRKVPHEMHCIIVWTLYPSLDLLYTAEVTLCRTVSHCVALCRTVSHCVAVCCSLVIFHIV